MVSIYCIEDINDNKYIGSTIQELSVRFNRHKQDKRHNKYCSSSKLNLDYCIIYELESCKKKIGKKENNIGKIILIVLMIMIWFITLKNVTENIMKNIKSK